jgi:hypothetical protein
VIASSIGGGGFSHNSSLMPLKVPSPFSAIALVFISFHLDDAFWVPQNFNQPFRQ